jgi:hypothetical protein
VIRRALNVSDDLGVDSLEGLPAILGREEFRTKVADAYQAIMPASIGAEDTFLASLYALARGEARAISKVRRDARREWREIDQIARREMLADLPATIDELMEQLESPASPKSQSMLSDRRNPSTGASIRRDRRIYQAGCICGTSAG